MKKLFILCLLTGPVFCVGKAQVKTSGSGDFLGKVGIAMRDFADSARSNWLGTGPRPLKVVIWYPSVGGGEKEVVNDPAQFSKPVDIFRGGEMPAKKYPLILISHGSGATALQMAWLGYYLASRGYIAVAVNHSGTPAEERLEGGFPLTELCMWERPKDLSVVLDKILEDTVFGGRVDTARIASAGFSLGGATAIWVAGAVLDFERLHKYSPPPPPVLADGINRQIELTKNDPIVQRSMKHAGDSFKDRRIKAVFALAPAIGQGFTADGLKGVRVPVQIVVGDADLIAPMAENARYYAENIKGARALIVLPGERGHYLKKAIGDEHAVELGEVSGIAYRFFQDVLR